jgi:multicomponent Na+:H+ antiporter subunit F
MNEAFFAVGVAILLSVAAGLALIRRGATAGDRLLAVQLVGTGGVAVLLVLGSATGQEALVDVALVYALLASGLLIAFVKVGQGPGRAPFRSDHE